ncbi:MAG: SAM-dependent methyltransferase [Holdemanella sp.]|nr:SAM-dependent methyltransferase [Holdemanella sp.]
MMIQTSKRLSTLVEWIDGTVLADIGCDHGYVAVNAILLEKVEKAYACDIAQGPLENAKKTIHLYHVEEKVIPYLMNGIENLPEDVDTIVIAGMGAKTIIEILSASFGKLKKNMKLYLLPHKDVNELRDYCSQNGIDILKETIIFEDNHFYPLLECEISLTPYTMSDKEKEYGRHVIVSKEYKEFIQTELDKWSNILKKVPVSRKIEIEKRLELLHEIKAKS